MTVIHCLQLGFGRQLHLLTVIVETAYRRELVLESFDRAAKDRMTMICQGITPWAAIPPSRKRGNEPVRSLRPRGLLCDGSFFPWQFSGKPIRCQISGFSFILWTFPFLNDFLAATCQSPPRNGPVNSFSQQHSKDTALNAVYSGVGSAYHSCGEAELIELLNMALHRKLSGVYDTGQSPSRTPSH